MKIVGYRCEKCNKTYEELCNDSEKPAKILKTCECGGKIVLWNFKDNCHRWSYFDRGGL